MPNELHNFLQRCANGVHTANAQIMYRRFDQNEIPQRVKMSK